MKRTSILVIATVMLVLMLALAAPAATVNCSGVAAWSGSGVAYATGTLVTFQGSEYKCAQGHTSQAGWDPVSVPALWTLVGACTSGATPTPTATPTATAKPTATPTATATAKPTATATATAKPTATASAKPTATATATPKPTATATPGAGCSPAWNASTAYGGGSLVSFNGVNYQAAYWTQGNEPDTNNGPQGSGKPWISLGACGGTGGATPTPTASGPTPTPTAVPPGTTTGTVTFHVLLGQSSNFKETLTLDGGNYNDLIMSNMIAGVMYGHLVDEGFPGMQFNKDYLYGSVMGQLLQENLATEDYMSSSNLLDPASEQQPVMGAGQGGPYQINNYTVDMVSGTTPAGHSLVNFIAIQKNIGYTISTAGAQSSQPTPASFNNKYYGPMLPAFFHYIDMLSLHDISKNGGTPPWEPAYDQALTTFTNLPNNFLEMLLNAAYNQGYYGGLVAQYSQEGVTATASTIATVDSYSTVWGATSTFVQYPYQVHYYMDQMYGNPIPTTSPTTTVVLGNHIAFNMTTLEGVFSNVAQTLSYSNGTNAAQFFTAAQAQSAFNSALSSHGVSSAATLDLSVASDRATIFAVIDSALSNLESAVGMKFNTITLSQL